MMEYPVVHNGSEVGTCSMQEQGLYWLLECRCGFRSERVERLYSGTTRLAVLEQEGDRLVCRRRLSKRSFPELPPRSGVFSLCPMEAHVPWEGYLLGRKCSGFRKGDTLLFPYAADGPCPCEPLVCFFSVKDGFWQLPVMEEWVKNEPVGG